MHTGMHPNRQENQLKKIAAASLTALALSCGSALIVGAIPQQYGYVTAKTVWPGAEPLPFTVGALDPKLYTKAQLCGGWEMDKTSVNKGLAKMVANLYEFKINSANKVSGHQWDRLIPQELGGDTSFLNVWPQPTEEDDAKNKDEKQLYKMMCAGEVTRERAVQLLLNNWDRRSHPS